MGYGDPHAQVQREPFDRSLIGVLLGSTLVFNLLDAILTILVVTMGLAVEANPLMAAALDESPIVFGVVKMGIASAGCYVLWRHRERTIAVMGTAVVFTVYAGVMIYQLQSVRLVALALASGGL